MRYLFGNEGVGVSFDVPAADNFCVVRDDFGNLIEPKNGNTNGW